MSEVDFLGIEHFWDIFSRQAMSGADHEATEWSKICFFSGFLASKGIVGSAYGLKDGRKLIGREIGHTEDFLRGCGILAKVESGD